MKKHLLKGENTNIQWKGCGFFADRFSWVTRHGCTASYHIHKYLCKRINVDKYNNKYRIPSARLQSWDYGWQANYFITICTHNKNPYFGDITGNKMHFNEMGIIAEQEWLKTPSIRRDMNIILDEFVVMPNHFHGILMIGTNEFNDVGRTRADGTPEETARPEHKTMDVITPINSFGPQRKNVSSILRGFKSSVTTYARKNHIAFGWQERFHDHIIRDEGELNRIRVYITQNVRNWKKDKWFLV